MILCGEVVPRRDATPDQLRQLGACLRAWFTRLLDDLMAADSDADGWISGPALDDLAAGELPKPALLRWVAGVPGLVLGDARAAVEAARASSPLARKALPAPTARGVSFGLSTNADVRGLVIDALPHCLPSELVDRIEIDGKRIAEGNAGG